LLPERVWLLRHAETTAPHVFNGAESDVDLSELGVRQSAAAADWFAQHRPTAVVSSAMRRAIATAAPIAAACGVPHTVHPRLHERRVGAMSGTSFSADGGPWNDTVAAWTAGNTAFTTPGAESFDDLAARLVPAWDEVCAAHPGGRVVVVAHGIVCKVLLLCLLDGHDPSHWGKLGRSANVAVSELVPRANGKWTAEQLLIVPDPVRVLTEQAARTTGVSSA
jgi:2,3-bisphosphoglycerate-dependent phosphoglycerate mutase